MHEIDWAVSLKHSTAVKIHFGSRASDPQTNGDMPDYDSCRIGKVQLVFNLNITFELSISSILSVYRWH